MSTFSYTLTVFFICIFQLSAAQDICTSPTGNFTVVVDLFAGELGYFTFEECPGLKNPTIGIEIGQTYNFIQADRSNWYHPMGFAYFPDGAHDEKDELEPGITQTSSNCAANFTCPTPRYFRDGIFLGNWAEPSDFGLDVYEPEFFLSVVDWFGAGTYSIELFFDDEEYTQDIFYFCHIHQYMTGRIKLLKGGVPVSEANEPSLEYQYDSPGQFDEKCGTFGLDAYQLPNIQCPDRFVCLGNDVTDSSLVQYATCIDAMNCAMLAGMTTGYAASSPVALFIHQMIPHHRNAVNMAKVLLHQNVLECSDLTNEDDPVCHMEAILRDIVNTQNFQIQGMLKILEQKNIPVTEDCMVEVSTLRMAEDNTTNGSSGSFQLSMGMTVLGLIVSLCLLYC